MGWKKSACGRQEDLTKLTHMEVHVYIYIYREREHIYTYMLHKEKYINYTENRGSRPLMKNTDVTGKYIVKVIFL